MATSIQNAKESALSNAVGFVHRDFRDSAKAAILNDEAELRDLLQLLPGTPALESLVGRKIAVWVDMKKIDLILQQIRSGMEVNYAAFDDFIMATLNDISSVPDDGLDDFHPSRTLLSATLRIDLARKTGSPTDYASVGCHDPALWAHPLIADPLSRTRQWYTGKPNGRMTPVPHPLQTTLPVMRPAQRPTQAGPMIAQPMPVRPQRVVPEATPTSLPELERGRKVDTGSKRTRKASRSRSRVSKTKSAEFVEDTDEEMKEVKRAKKGKAKAVDDAMEVDDPHVVHGTDAMDIDNKARSRPITPKPSAGIIKIKPASKIIAVPVPVSTSAADSSTNPSGACDRCHKLQKSCTLEADFVACIPCRKHKTKCSIVHEGWRSQRKTDKSGEGSTSTFKLRNPATPRAARAKTPVIERATTPARPRSKSRARSVAPTPDEASTVLPVPPPRRRSQPPSQADLGQVPSQYVYLLSREGQDVSTGIRLRTGEEGLADDEKDRKIQELESRNTEMERKLSLLVEEVSSLKNTIAMLVSGQNTHSAALEAHRLLLVGPRQPSDFHSRSGSDSPRIPGPPTTTPDPDLVGTGLLTLPPDHANPAFWDHDYLNMNAFGMDLETTTASHSSNHLSEPEGSGVEH